MIQMATLIAIMAVFIGGIAVTTHIMHLTDDDYCQPAGEGYLESQKAAENQTHHKHPKPRLGSSPALDIPNMMLLIDR